MPEQPMRFSDLAAPYTVGTGYRSGIWPKSIAGAGLSSVLGTLAGAGIGRYLAAPAMSWLFPEIKKEKARRIGTVLGGLAGFAPAALLGYGDIRTAQSVGNPWYTGLYGDHSNIRPEHNAMDAVKDYRDVGATVNSPGPVSGRDRLRSAEPESGFVA